MTCQPDVNKYYALALDPIHVGTGGMRLGRVDMSIVREPGTNVPKIPGTSLSGAARTYAAMQEEGKFPHCAGQGQADTGRGYQGHCGRPDCPICVTFGFSKGDQGSFQGLAQFSDARLVFFPVHSLAGPVWVTCPDALKDLEIPGAEPEDHQVRVASGVKASGRLNLGWLMLDVASNDFALQDQVPNVPQDILKHAVLVSNKMFGHIVNDNLEVRTSVSIDPATGAAAERALFTYEALPRASVLYFEVVVSDPQFYKIGDKAPLQNNGGKQKVIKTVEKGLTLFESLGVGGMNTRGMGRLRVLNLSAGGAE
ncbi:MAG: type III-B CRISPR module RAMP protein Cmr4 [Chloroflexi bacterium]|nr:type III-B CRISPR module RAMP protein Cmr4 [Chloroflexota bacterium]